jgi:hypothetical protein
LILNTISHLDLNFISKCLLLLYSSNKCFIFERVMLPTFLHMDCELLSFFTCLTFLVIVKIIIKIVTVWEFVIGYRRFISVDLHFTRFFKRFILIIWRVIILPKLLLEIFVTFHCFLLVLSSSYRFLRICLGFHLIHQFVLFFFSLLKCFLSFSFNLVSFLLVLIVNLLLFLIQAPRNRCLTIFEIMLTILFFFIVKASHFWVTVLHIIHYKVIAKVCFTLLFLWEIVIHFLWFYTTRI